MRCVTGGDAQEAAEAELIAQGLPGDLVEEVTKLKKEPSDNIISYGFGPVARTLDRPVTDRPLSVISAE